MTELSHEEMKKILFGIVSHHPKSYSQVLKHYPEILDKVHELTSHLDKFHVNLKTRIFWVLNDLKDAPRCMNEKCNRSLIDGDVKNINYGYPHHCCPQCAKDSSARKSKYESTCEKKYGKGIKNSFSDLGVRAKAKQKVISTYGVDNPAKSQQAKDNSKKTCLEKYGCEYAFQADEVKKKIEDTNRDRYGVKSYSQTDEYDNKVKMTNQQKFGVDYPMQDAEFRRNAQKRYEYDGMQFDSKLELALYMHCKLNDIKCKLHPEVSISYQFEDKMHSYQPDFRIENDLVEVKGLHFFEDKDPANAMINPFDRSQDALYEAKHQCMIEHNVKILTDKDCQKYVKFVEQQLGKDFFSRCKRKNRLT